MDHPSNKSANQMDESSLLANERNKSTTILSPELCLSGRQPIISFLNSDWLMTNYPKHASTFIGLIGANFGEIENSQQKEGI